MLYFIFKAMAPHWNSDETGRSDQKLYNQASEGGLCVVIPSCMPRRMYFLFLIIAFLRLLSTQHQGIRPNSSPGLDISKAPDL